MFSKIDPDKLRGQQSKDILEHDFSKGPLLVIGGPGTGKTYNLIKTIEKALSEGHKSDKLFVTSFTNEAVGKLKKEIIEKIGVELKNLSTLHSRAKGILHRYYDQANLPKDFGVLSDKLEEQPLLKDVQYEFGLLGKKYKINQLKRELLKNSQKARGAMEEPPNSEFEKIFNSLKQFYHVVDWYDVVYLANKILSDNPEIKEAEGRISSLLLVDEYQDLNFAEQEFIRLVNNERTYLMVVGDSDQSIYSGRFANPLGILKFEKMYPAAKSLILKVSSRCPDKILIAAHNLIKNNRRKERGRLFAHSDVKKIAGEGLIESVRCKSNKEEASFLGEAISTLKNQEVKEEDMLVLFPNSKIGEKYIEAISDSQYSIKIDNRLRPTLEIDPNEKMIDYLISLSGNPQDNLALRIISERLLGFQIKKILQCRTLANESSISLLEAFLSSDGRKILGTSAEKVISLFKILKSQELSIEEKLEKVVVSHDNLREAHSRWLKQRAKISDKEEKDHPIALKKPSGVRFMTLHRSKGLDAKFVFLPCLENAIIPGRWEHEEQRRLLYVGIARAKKAVILSWAWSRIGASRHKAGKGGPTERKRSVFIDEMGLQDVESQKGVKMLKSYSKKWH